ncbi:2'-5' RNA ligase family protein [Sediminibacterium ginsengisoli]|uniref:2'-5' RNA ligase superfamily protein n=1 Tax=Sediminibacterium ginsengisoli TaxID=413434 RepID=A0A1T4K9K9_9BACT|nr:2'-5' RNA ligase family protein [Sediminibacterium ginsengisoli]SJZ39091.1 2'-5' RNA ligase superfamily protein [Sediminibacterium ginsengisoli]
MATVPPLIITLGISPDAASYFTELRNIHYPAHANLLNAHLTLFHRLPSDEKEIHSILSAAVMQQAMELAVTGIVLWKKGVAFTIDSPQLQEFHSGLQHALEKWTCAKDQKPLKPHITIQNKVTAFKASLTHKKLAAGFVPFTILATGLDCFHFSKGKWERIAFYPFGETAHKKTGSFLPAP